jgi:hypothetical protein
MLDLKSAKGLQRSSQAIDEDAFRRFEQSSERPGTAQPLPAFALFLGPSVVFGPARAD